MLPIIEILPHLKNTLATHSTIILQAPPGAGKSTVLPISLLEEKWLGNQKILMLEPRRLAARAVAKRMADLKEEKCGDTVGYRVRFENNVSANTRLEVLTEGILTRMIQSDNTLEGVGMVIFDEFHERNLQGDLALALCLQVQQVLRPELRILIMSATLDGNKLSGLLNNAPIITCSGRQFPIQVNYIDTPVNTPLPLNMARAIKSAINKYEGDVLAFFPGAGEIQKTHELLEQEHIGAVIYDLYGDLPVQQQQEAIMPHPQGRRKVVLSTSIAETSLTIEGTKIVVDCGFSRVPKFDLQTGLTKLTTVRVTKDSAEQRAGRAGRLGPGTCIRLWSEGTHLHLTEHRTPEILVADLAPMMLELMKWGIKYINELTWITPPLASSVNQATELLQQLGAVENNKITEHGKKMLSMPTHPRIAHLLNEAKNQNSVMSSLATDVAALLEERDPLSKEQGTDLTLRIEQLRKMRSGERVNINRTAFARIEKLAASWRKLMQAKEDNTAPDEESVGELISYAYPERIARQLEKNSVRYRLANGRIVKLPENDALSKETWLAVAHLDAGSNEGKIFLAAPIDISGLMHLAKEKEVIVWDKNKGMISATLEKRIGSVILESKAIDKVSAELRIQIICDAIQSEGLKMLPWSEKTDEWQARVLSARKWNPQEEWPDVSNENLLATVHTWLAPYLLQVNKQNDLDRLNLTEILLSVLPWQLQQRLDTIAPYALQVPSGSMIAVNYFKDGRTPEMSVRLQEVFGWLETPTVNEGKEKIRMQLLSPGYKPVQVTQDLHSFWDRTYAEVRKELRMRYPRHSWPEDPWTAVAVRGAKKRGT